MNTKTKAVSVGALLLALGVGAVTPALAKPGKGAGMMSFSALDANGDGIITKDDLAVRDEARFKSIDADGNGSVTQDELAAHAEAKRAKREKARQERMMKRLDANEDGVLSAEEMFSGKRAEKMFAKVDRNGDGQISEEEFDAMKKHRGKRGGKKRHGKREYDAD